MILLNMCRKNEDGLSGWETINYKGPSIYDGHIEGGGEGVQPELDTCGQGKGEG